MRHQQHGRPFDEQVYHRFKRSLARPIGWASVTGEVRSVGRAQGGLSGTVRSELVGNVVHFEAPAHLEDSLRETLFRRALVSGETEVDGSGAIKRVVVERVELLGQHQRLTDLDLADVDFDPAGTLDALRELRRG